MRTSSSCSRLPWSLAGLLAGFLVIVVALAADTALLLRSVDGSLPVTPAAPSVTVAVAPFTV
jgi:hypothetical protein